MENIICDNRKREYINPVRIIYANDLTENPSVLLEDNPTQPILGDVSFCKMSKGASVILDFGVEINGSVRIVTHGINGGAFGRVRVRFGESVSETMAEIGEKNAGCDHAPRDIELAVS